MRVAILLLAVASVFANPFHKGASWEWRLLPDTHSNLADIYPTSIFGVVIDSNFVPESSSVLWRLEFRPDSADHELADTAHLMTDIDGKNGRWLKRSYFMSFEFRDIAEPCWSTCVTAPDSFWMPLKDDPKRLLYQLWSDSLGLLSGTTYERRYDLIAKDGRSLLDWGIDNGRRVVLPSVGLSFLWEVLNTGWSRPCWDTASYCKGSQFESRFSIGWILNKRPADSSGWVRAEVIQTRIGSYQTINTTIDLRWNPLLGTVTCGQDSLAQKMAKGFLQDWTDSITSTGRIRRDSATWRVINEYWERNWTSTNGKGWLDSVLFSNSFIGHNGNFGGGYTGLSLRLLQVDDSVIRQPSSTGIKRSASRHTIGLGDLRSLALRYPSASVVVRDVKGASQTMRLDQLLNRQAAPKLGLRWLEVHLPDGSVRRGSTVL